MKFMILVKSNPDLEARLAAMSDSQMKEQMAAMGVFNEELKKAGVMKDCDGRRDAMSGARGCPLDGRVRRLLLEARRRAESCRHRRTRGQTSSKERAQAYSSPRLLPGQTCRNVTGTRHRGLRAARCLRPFPDTLA